MWGCPCREKGCFRSASSLSSPSPRSSPLLSPCLLCYPVLESDLGIDSEPRMGSGPAECPRGQAGPLGWSHPQVAGACRDRLLSASAHHCPSVRGRINIWPGLGELGFLSGSLFPILRTVASEEDPGVQTETSLPSS